MKGDVLTEFNRLAGCKVRIPERIPVHELGVLKPEYLWAGKNARRGFDIRFKPWNWFIVSDGD